MRHAEMPSTKSASATSYWGIIASRLPPGAPCAESHQEHQGFPGDPRQESKLVRWIFSCAEMLSVKLPKDEGVDQGDEDNPSPKAVLYDILQAHRPNN